MKAPLLLKNFVPKQLLEAMNSRLDVLQDSTSWVQDGNLFHRKCLHDEAFFKKIHQDIFTPIVLKRTGENLKPSYSFISHYDSEESICPIHTDRPQCYLTLDVCLKQHMAWPLYVENKDLASQNSIEFVLEPGDALIYYGSRQPHWRKKIDPGNFCFMAFFHFVPEDFVGELR
jgi:hypothetical protein